MILKKYFVLFCLVLSGCVSNTTVNDGKLEFYNVVKSHRDLTNETNPVIVSSIRDELKTTSLTDDNKQLVESLIERIEFIQKQSNIIYDFVVATKVDPDLVSKLLKATWKKENK